MHGRIVRRVSELKKTPQIDDICNLLKDIYALIDSEWLVRSEDLNAKLINICLETFQFKYTILSGDRNKILLRGITDDSVHLKPHITYIFNKSWERHVGMMRRSLTISSPQWIFLYLQQWQTASLNWNGTWVVMDIFVLTTAEYGWVCDTTWHDLIITVEPLVYIISLITMMMVMRKICM